MFVNSHNLIKFKSPTLYILEHIYLPTHPYQLQLYFISSSNFLTKKELTIQYIHPPFRSLYRNFKNLRSDLELFSENGSFNLQWKKCSCTIEKYTPEVRFKILNWLQARYLKKTFIGESTVFYSEIYRMQCALICFQFQKQFSFFVNVVFQYLVCLEIFVQAGF